MRQAKEIMMDAIEKNLAENLKDPLARNSRISIAYTENRQAAEEFKQEVIARFGDREIWVDPLSLSVSCHIGPGALAITCTKNLM